ncbi:MAG: sulfite exporter TauE/SafE family protein [Nitrososphaerota archaeon]
MLYLHLLALLALGACIGAYGSLIGVGGGFLMVPLLITVYNFEPRMAAGTSLFFVFLNVLSGSFAYFRLRRIDFKVGSMFMSVTVPGAILGAFLTGYFESSIFKGAFAMILTITSIYLIIRPVREDRSRGLGGYSRRLRDSEGEEYSYSVHILRGLLISFLVGFISSIFGIGGGIIHVPVMIFVLGFPTHIATATSFFILLFTSLVGSATHTSLGNVNLEFAIVAGIGAIVGAQLGASASRRVRGTIIERLLGIALLIVAVRLILTT